MYFIFSARCISRSIIAAAKTYLTSPGRFACQRHISPFLRDMHAFEFEDAAKLFSKNFTLISEADNADQVSTQEGHC